MKNVIMNRWGQAIQAPILTILILTMTACGGMKGMKKVSKEPCSVPSDKGYYRSFGDGSSIKRSISYDKALALAQSRVAQLIQTDVDGKWKLYQESVEEGAGGAGKESASEDFQRGAQGVINQSLKNTVIHCDQAFQKKDGTYVTYIGVELDKEEVNKALNDVALDISKKREIRHNSEVFFETFNN